jgi:hypothetical protein
MNISQKEEFRYKFAGQVLPQLIDIASKLDTTQEIDFLNENQLIASLRFQLQEFEPEKACALIARKFADALIAELDRENKP